MKIKVRKILEKLRKLEVQPKRSNITANGHSEPKNKENGQEMTIKSKQEINTRYFSRLKILTIIIGERPTLKPITVKF